MYVLLKKPYVTVLLIATGKRSIWRVFIWLLKFRIIYSHFWRRQIEINPTNTSLQTPRFRFEIGRIHVRVRVSGWDLNSDCYLVPFWFSTDFYPKGNARQIMRPSSWINLLISDYLKCGFDADVDCMQCRIESKIRHLSHRWLSIIWVQSIIFLYLWSFKLTTAISIMTGHFGFSAF